MDALVAVCVECGALESFFRCRDCCARPSFCRTCCVRAHKYSPFHHIEEWKDSSYQRGDLDLMGYTIYLGHGGSPCRSHADISEAGTDQVLPDHLCDNEPPSHAPEDNEAILGPSMELKAPGFGWPAGAEAITIVHTNGVFKRHIKKCSCVGSDRKIMPFHMQLFRSRLFPATTTFPRTAMTLSALDDYHLQMVECHTTVSSYFQKIRRSTNHAFPSNIPVSKPLLRIGNFWACNFSRTEHTSLTVFRERIECCMRRKRLAWPTISIE